jgi:membrane protease YdiL (CAAX protease family)
LNFEACPPLPAETLPERVAAAGLLIPVVLMLLLSTVTGQDGSAGPIALSNMVLAQGVVVELVLSLTLGLWLWRRGWRPHRTVTRPLVQLDVVRGLALWVSAIAAVGCWAVVCKAVFPDLFKVAKQTEMVGAPDLWVSAGFSIFNAVFEELLWLGLGFAAFRRFGSGVAATISVGLRLLAHGYQGPLALVTVLPVAVLFTLYYVRTRRIWPVVVAHAFQDTLALSLIATTARHNIA